MMTEPPPDCSLCPRLSEYRTDNRAAQPSWFNGAVPNFGPSNARLLIVGLAPGVTGANRTGRPFTGDYAGDLLYATLSRFGFAIGNYDKRADDGLQLNDCRITNAVRCVPPQNKPLPIEINTCRPFLTAQLTPASPETARPEIILCLGKIAHDSTIRALGGKLSHYPFKHAMVHAIDDLTLIDSYHCSRYNTNTGRLTEDMFADVFAIIRELLTEPKRP